jgi:hypothetical protein
MKMDEGQTSTGTPDTAIPRRPLSDEERRKTTVAFDEITERATDCSALVEALSYKLKNKEMSTAEVSFTVVYSSRNLGPSRCDMTKYKLTVSTFCMYFEHRE